MAVVNTGSDKTMDKVVGNFDGERETRIQFMLRKSMLADWVMLLM